MKNKAAECHKCVSKSQTLRPRANSDSALVTSTPDITNQARAYHGIASQRPPEDGLLQVQERKSHSHHPIRDSRRVQLVQSQATENALPPLNRSDAMEGHDHLSDRLNHAKALLRFSRRRDKVLQIRSQLAFEQHNLRHARSFEYESIQQLLDAFQNALQDAAVNSKFNDKHGELDALYRQCESDRAVLNANEMRITSLQTDLDVLEYRLMKKENEFALTTLKEAELNISGSIDDITDNSGNTSTDIPSLLGQYYDRKGDVGVQLERLDDLEDSYLEERERHDFLTDQGEMSIDSESVLRLRYEEQRQQILHELEAAQQDVHALEIACREAGIPIEARSRSGAEAAATSESHGGLVDIFNDTRSSSGGPVPTPIATLPIAHLSKWSRGGDEAAQIMPRAMSREVSKEVLAWLDDVAAGSPTLPHFGIEGLDLASALTIHEQSPTRKATQNWHCRSYSYEGIAHSSGTLRAIAV